MTLPVPLTVRVGDTHITREVSSLSFRKEAVGGVRNITFKVARPLVQLDPNLSTLAKVYVYDGRSAETVAQGRLADTGRGADGGSGEAWDVVAFGPVQHASDIEAPLIYVDRSVSDGWVQVDVPARSKPTIGASSKPGSTAALAAPGVAAQFPEGENVMLLDHASLEYRRIYEAGQKLAQIQYGWDTGHGDGNWILQVSTGIAGVDTTTVGNHTANIAGGSGTPVVVTNWANGHNTLRLTWIYAAATAPAPANSWAWWDNFCVRAMLLDKAGADITTGYVNNYVFASEVVADLLGRWLDQFDGANATVATTATNIPQLAYPDGVTATRVLEDMMSLEPAYRWYTTPDTTGGGYGFRWELWPTTVRSHCRRRTSTTRSRCATRRPTAPRATPPGRWPANCWTMKGSRGARRSTPATRSGGWPTRSWSATPSSHSTTCRRTRAT